MVVPRARHFLFLLEPLRFAYGTFVFSLLFYLVIPHSRYVFGDEIGSLRPTDQVSLFLTSELNVVSAHSWVVLETSGRFSPSYCKFFARRLFSLIGSRSRKFSCLVILVIFLQIEGNSGWIFVGELVSDILNRISSTSAGPGFQLFPSKTFLWDLGIVYFQLFLYCVSAFCEYLINASVV